MEQYKDDIADSIKAWMSNDVDEQELDNLKKQLSTTSAEALNEIITPIWNSYDNDSINERSNRLQQQSLLKEKLIKLHTKYRRLQIAAVLIPAILTIGFVASYIGMNEQPNYFELQAMKGEKSFLNLPDQSKVWLNSDSYLKYTSDFSVKERHLYLDGEGFFDVAHQNGIPFTVSVGKINIVVKGTKFNVKNDLKEIEVALLEGKVDIFCDDNQLLASLLPNQVINIDATDSRKYVVRNENVDRYGIWSQNKLVIQNENLFDISKKIEKWYGVNVHLFNVEPNQRYTFTIKTESLNETLNLLNQLTSVEYSVNGEEVIIRQK